ncbi:MAG TPA: hypothetical protein VN493_03450 [Thermoanaerobaculia bacterium]|nr:hypothetical protein [Thermoanaerobaculia bacterium]
MSRFDVLLSLRVTHAYYGGLCQDFGFVLPQDTAKLMRGHKLLTRDLNGVLHVLYPADESSTPLAGKTLRIGLKLLNSSFGNFTETGFNPGSATAYYRNHAAPNQLDAPEPVTLIGNKLSLSLTDTARPATVALLDSSGDALRSETVADDRSSVSFDLAGVPPGSCTVEETYPGDVNHSAACYLDPELLQAGVLGLVEIRIDGSFPASPPAFEIAFDARREVLKYYLVVKNYTSAELDQFIVSDAGFSDEARPEVTFTKVPAAAFTPAEIPPALLGGGDVILFKSQALVARQAKGRRRIQLSRNGDVLIENLPQPGADRSDANLIVHVSKP